MLSPPLHIRLQFLHRLLHPAQANHLSIRTLSTTPRLYYAGPKPLPPRPTIVEDDITEAFLKGTGPGGQKINKTSSAVQLKHLPTGIVIKCQETRSRTQNRKIARRILAERIEDLEKGDESRTALKIGRAQKKKASKDKKARRKYRKLAEGEEGEEGEEDADGEHVDGEVVGHGPSREGEATVEKPAVEEPIEHIKKTKSEPPLNQHQHQDQG